jgi:hypothetical protein
LVLRVLASTGSLRFASTLSTLSTLSTPTPPTAAPIARLRAGGLRARNLGLLLPTWRLPVLAGAGLIAFFEPAVDDFAGPRTGLSDFAGLRTGLSGLATVTQPRLLSWPSSFICNARQRWEAPRAHVIGRPGGLGLWLWRRRRHRLGRLTSPTRERGPFGPVGRNESNRLPRRISVHHHWNLEEPLLSLLSLLSIVSIVSIVPPRRLATDGRCDQVAVELRRSSVHLGLLGRSWNVDPRGPQDLVDDVSLLHAGSRLQIQRFSDGLKLVALLLLQNRALELLLWTHELPHLLLKENH